MDESGGAPERPGPAAGVAAVPVGNVQQLLAGRPADVHAAFAAASERAAAEAAEAAEEAEVEEAAVKIEDVEES